MSKQKLIPNLIIQNKVATEFNTIATELKIPGVDMKYKNQKLTFGYKKGLFGSKEVEVLFSNELISFKFKEQLDNQLIEKIEPILLRIQEKLNVSFILPKKLTFLKRINGEWYK